MKMNTVFTYTFADGTTTEMTLTFYKVYQLRNKNEKLYREYNSIMVRGTKNEFDMLKILYVAYACAHLGEELMSEEEFIIKCGCDRAQLMNAVSFLTTGKTTEENKEIEEEDELKKD